MQRILNIPLYKLKTIEVFINLFLYFLFQPTIYELKTPLAFVIVAHSHLGLLEAQLSTIFRPHNAYCIFVDSKGIIHKRRHHNGGTGGGIP